MRPLFAEYRPSQHTAPLEVRRAHQIGLLPLAIALALMVSHVRPGPGLWSAVGVTLGLHMVLWSAYELHRSHRDLSEWGRALVATQDQWFPLLVFAVKSAFVVVVLCLLWFSLAELEFPTRWWHHALFALLVILLPARRFLNERMRDEYGRAIEIWNEATRQALVVVCALGGASFLTSLMSAQAEGFPVEITYLLLIVWILASLVALSAIALFFSRTVRRRKVYTVRVQTDPFKPESDPETF